MIFVSNNNASVNIVFLWETILVKAFDLIELKQQNKTKWLNWSSWHPITDSICCHCYLKTQMTKTSEYETRNRTVLWQIKTSINSFATVFSYWDINYVTLITMCKAFDIIWNMRIRNLGNIEFICLKRCFNNDIYTASRKCFAK